jgi:hypothetical protein
MKDRLFVQVLIGLSTLAIVYGVGIVVVFLVNPPSDQVFTRFMSSFGAVFAGLLGLCTGYLLGARGNGHDEHG